jgi:SAM-dependent methyltransferase
MFGSIYSGHPDVLRQSLLGMNQGYSFNKPTGLMSRLQRAYIRLFGIPEIGFRLRAVYFGRSIKWLPRKPARLLDAGSGIGAYSVLLAQRYPSAKVTGCDLDAAKTAFSAELSKELGLTNLEFMTGDITNLRGLTEPFDAIVCIDVLEHVADYQAALRCFSSLLRPGGVLYLHTPQPNQERILKRFRNWQHEGHVREGFVPHVLVSDLSEVGFDVVEVRETFGVIGKLAWELNHLTLSWNQGVAGLVFPVLYLLARLDSTTNNRRGLGITLTARRMEYHRENESSGGALRSGGLPAYG